MRAFEISINGQVVCVAGLDDFHVVSGIVSFVRQAPDPPGPLEFNVSGFDAEVGEDGEHALFLQQNLAVGDTVSLRIIETNSTSEPTRRWQIDAARKEEKDRADYERLKRKYEATPAP